MFKIFVSPLSSRPNVSSPYPALYQMHESPGLWLGGETKLVVSTVKDDKLGFEPVIDRRKS